MRIYNITFTEMELNKFNLIEEEIRHTCMSVYQYFIKLNEKENEQYTNAELSHLKESTKLKISMRDFIKKYKRSHPNLSLSALKKIVDLLIKYGLIKVERVKNCFCYSFYRFFHILPKNKTKNNLEPAQPVENTDLASDDEEHKYLNNIYTIDIDTKTKQDFVDNHYIDKQEKVSSWQEVYSALQEAFKIRKMHKQSKRKNRILTKVYQNWKNITKKHLLSYILTAIDNTREESKINYNKNKFGNYNSKPSTFNDYNQRQYKDGELNYLAEIKSGHLEYRTEEYKLKMKEMYGY